MTVEQAQKQAAEVIAEIEGGANPAEAKRALREEPTLAEFFSEYGDRHGNKSCPGATTSNDSAITCCPPWASAKLSGIDRAMIARMLSDAEKAGKSAGTVRQIRALASNMLSKAVEWGYLDANPAQSVKVSGSTVKRDRFLQPDELARFFEAVVAEPNDIIRDLILLALLTGARRSNVCAMHWREIDLKAGVWKIKRTKNGEPQTITLCPEAVAILEARQAATGERLCFPGTGRTGHIAEPRKGFERCWSGQEFRMGATWKTGWYCMTCGGRWEAGRRRTGASLAIIGKSLNHKSQQATAIYARLDLDPVRQSVNTATAAMFEAAG